MTGPGATVWEYGTYVPSMNFYTIRVSKLLELDAQVSDKDRIPQLFSIDKFLKSIPENLTKDVLPKKSDEITRSTVKKGKTLMTGYINRNNQENLGCLNKPGNHANQTAYMLRCNNCGFEYEANGCDVAIRKCPQCM